MERLWSAWCGGIAALVLVSHKPLGVPSSVVPAMFPVSHDIPVCYPGPASGRQ